MNGVVMKIKFCLHILALVFILYTSCQTKSNATKILESSSEVKPEWVQGKFQGFESHKEFLIKYTLKNIQRLEMGIKQTQLEGITKTKELFEERFTSEVMELFKKFTAKVNKPNAQNEVLAVLKKVLSQLTVVEASPKSVYWEKIAVGNEPADNDVSFEYIVTVLLALPRSEYTGAMAQLTDALESAREPSAKQFGKWLSNN